MINMHIWKTYYGIAVQPVRFTSASTVILFCATDVKILETLRAVSLEHLNIFVSF